MDSTPKDKEGIASEQSANGNGVQTVVELSESEPVVITIKGEKEDASGATPSCAEPLPQTISPSINPVQSTASPNLAVRIKQARRSFPAAFKLMAIDHHKQGNSRKDTAGLFGVSVKLVEHWLQHEEQLRSSPAGKRKLKPQNCKRAPSVAVATDNAKSAVPAEGPVVQWQDPTQPSPLVQALHDLVHTKGADLPLEPLPPTSPFPPSISASSKAGQDSSTSVEGGGGPSQVQGLTFLPTSQMVSSALIRNPTFDLTRSITAMSQPSLSTLRPSPGVQKIRSREPPFATVRPLSSLMATATGSPEANVALLKTLSEGAVGQLLDAMNLSRYKKKFGEEQIDGELLTSLGDTELKELGVESSLHRLRLKKLALGVYSPQSLLRKRAK